MLSTLPQLGAMDSAFRDMIERQVAAAEATAIASGEGARKQFGRSFDLSTLLRAGSADGMQTALTGEPGHASAFCQIPSQNWPKPPMIEVPPPALLEGDLVPGRYASSRRGGTDTAPASRAASWRVNDPLPDGLPSSDGQRLNKAMSQDVSQNSIHSSNTLRAGPPEEGGAEKAGNRAGSTTPKLNESGEGTEGGQDGEPSGMSDDEGRDDDEGNKEDSEEDRQKKRRASNRESARRTRHRKIMEVHTLQKQISNLTQSNIALVKKAERLTAHNSALLQSVPALGDRCKKAVVENMQLKEMVQTMRAALLNGAAAPSAPMQMQRAESAPADLLHTSNLEALLNSAFRMTRPDHMARGRSGLMAPAQLNVMPQMSEAAAVRNAIAMHLGVHGGGVGGLGQLGQMPPPQPVTLPPPPPPPTTSPFAAVTHMLAAQQAAQHAWVGASGEPGGPMMGEVQSALLELLQTAVSTGSGSGGSSGLSLGPRPAGVLPTDITRSASQA